jgi:hypothetical protein
MRQMANLEALNAADPRLPPGLFRAIADRNEQCQPLNALRMHRLLKPKTEKGGWGDKDKVAAEAGKIPAHQTHRESNREYFRKCARKRAKCQRREAAASPELP